MYRAEDFQSIVGGSSEYVAQQVNMVIEQMGLKDKPDDVHIYATYQESLLMGGVTRDSLTIMIFTPEKLIQLILHGVYSEEREYLTVWNMKNIDVMQIIDEKVGNGRKLTLKFYENSISFNEGNKRFSAIRKYINTYYI